MILTGAHLQNFRCVKDSDPFKIDKGTTCLVGKNESGKTALLQALNKLNPVIKEHGEFQDLDYPVMQWTEYKARKDEDPAPALSTTWKLEPVDVEVLRPTFGDSIAYNAEVEVSKGYSNKCSWGVRVDEAKLVAHLLGRFDLLADERTPLAPATSLDELRTRLGEIEKPTQRQGELNEFLGQEFGKDSAGARARALLDQQLPKFVYFADYLRLPGQVAINDLKVRVAKSDANKPLRDSDRAFLAYLALIGATVEDLENTREFERLTRELEAASNHLTSKMKQYWSQNRHLRVNCRFDAARPGDPAPFNAGSIVRTRIENTRHGVTTSFDERSAGFVWFFSFLVWFSQVKRQYGDNVVILLDEPGLSLHAKAQHDLLRYIERELESEHQVIYTTHSPFLIDPQNLLRARTVEDVFIEADDEKGIEAQDLGTKVGDDVLSTDRDTVFPLQACLGYEITQTLFVGKHTLLVEGPSDLLYLTWFRAKLAAAGRTTLDRRWTITPCGGIDKVAAFVALFGGENKIHVAVLTDLATGDKSKVERLRRSKLLEDGHVFTADTYATMGEADVEDLVGQAGYLDLVNRALGLQGTAKLGAPPSGGRIVKWVEDQARMLPATAPTFDHYLPAAHLVGLGQAFALAEEASALNRFERLFADLNKLLPAR
jgi:predicted ATPase